MIHAARRRETVVHDDRIRSGSLKISVAGFANKIVTRCTRRTRASIKMSAAVSKVAAEIFHRLRAAAMSESGRLVRALRHALPRRIARDEVAHALIRRRRQHRATTNSTDVFAYPSRFNSEAIARFPVAAHSPFELAKNYGKTAIIRCFDRRIICRRTARRRSCPRDIFAPFDLPENQRKIC